MYKPIYLNIFLGFLIFVNSLSAQNISTVAEIYNYEVGDVFHKRFYEEVDGYEWEKLYSRTIIDKFYSVENDTVFYTTDVIQMERESFPPGWEWSHYQQTGHITNLDSLINNGNIDTVFTDEELYNGREINYLEVDNYPNTYNKWRYVDGCGRAYNYYNSYGAGYYFTELLYYKKGDDEWGAPILILSQEEINDHAGITIYPNPARDQLNIKMEGLEFEKATLHTIHGKEICSQPVREAAFSVDVSGLQAGTYIIKLSKQDKVFSKVFVKE